LVPYNLPFGSLALIGRNSNPTARICSDSSNEENSFIGSVEPKAIEECCILIPGISTSISTKPIGTRPQLQKRDFSQSQQKQTLETPQNHENIKK
jgi:hypothetical protein